jgi:hypothetical protein
MKSTGRLFAVAFLLVTMAFSTPAFATSTASTLSNPLLINLNNIYNLGNSGGAIIFNPTTQTLSMTSTITSIQSGGQGYTGDFGTITFTTGALVSGSVYGFAEFGSGTYTITTNGTDGLPDGVLFSGTFTRALWHEIGHSDEYYFSTRGFNIHETTVLVAGTTQFNVLQGNTVIPEPSTWALLGTGIVFVMCGALHARFQRRTARSAS